MIISSTPAIVELAADDPGGGSVGQMVAWTTAINMTIEIAFNIGNEIHIAEWDVKKVSKE